MNSGTQHGSPQTGPRSFLAFGGTKEVMYGNCSHHERHGEEWLHSQVDANIGCSGH